MPLKDPTSIASIPRPDGSRVRALARAALERSRVPAISRSPQQQKEFFDKFKVYEEPTRASPRAPPVVVNHPIPYKVIPTKYKGYHFRSRTEARWAVALNYLGWIWDYEVEGFDLPAGWYLPDFALLGDDGICLWIEVKGKEPTRQEHRKLAQLVAATQITAVFAIGTPRDFNLGGYYWDMANGAVWDDVAANIGSEAAEDECAGGCWDALSDIDEAAIKAARAAKF